jgi:uncharacterized caspase-like protein/galactitol-specific phosphotransferase system IIB component
MSNTNQLSYVETPRRLGYLANVLIIIIACVLVPGCASKHSKVKKTTLLDEFAKGNAILDCNVPCSGRYGYERNKLQNLYYTEDWEELASRILIIGHSTDQAWYYLARSAEGLGHLSAAAKYYQRGLDISTGKAKGVVCGGFIDTCDGLNIPQLSARRLANLSDKVDQAIDPKTLKLASETQPSPTIAKDRSPPDILITSHNITDEIRVNKDQKSITISGNVFDRNGIVQILIDQQEIDLDASGNFNREIYLGYGVNRIVISAIDRFQNQAIKEFTIIRETSASAPIKPQVGSEVRLKGWYEKQFAIVIGIDKYHNEQLETLQNAVNDARAISNMLKKFGFEVLELYNQQATKRNIIDAISQISRQTKNNDSHIFYFAGHGKGFTLENRERVGYILPYDTKLSIYENDIIAYDDEAIPLSTIKKYAKNMKAKHIALIFDSCFSGLAMKRGIELAKKNNMEYYNDLLSRKAINILTAGDDQPVSDGTGHSPFTRALLQGLDQKGIDIIDRDGYVTFSQMATYVKEKVEKATGRRQRPQFDNLSFEDGDFVFMLP